MISWKELAVELCNSAEDGPAFIAVGPDGLHVTHEEGTYLVLCDCEAYGYPNDWVLDFSLPFENANPKLCELISDEFKLRVEQRSEEVYRNSGHSLVIGSKPTWNIKNKRGGN